MATIPFITMPEAQNTEAHAYKVKTGTTASIATGSFVIKDTTNAGYVKAVGTIELGNEDEIIGVSATTSDETATADGTVMVYDELATQVFQAKTVGTPTQAQVNTKVTATCTATTQKLNETFTTGGVFKIIDFNATDKTVKFIIDNAGTAGINVVQETVTRAMFTDGGAAVGTYKMTASVPVGAVAIRTMLTNITGFTGDTSAVITVGDGTDVDRYNTGTPSVFTTATAVDGGVASGTVYHSAAKTPVLTVTSATDFTAVTAGAVTVTILYYTA